MNVDMEKDDNNFEAMDTTEKPDLKTSLKPKQLEMDSNTNETNWNRSVTKCKTGLRVTIKF